MTLLCLTLPWLLTAALWIPLCLKLRIRAKPIAPLAIIAGAMTVFICICLDRSGLAIPLSAKISIQPVLIGLVSGIGIGILFTRDPDRRVPDGDGIVVSPADGTIRYVRPFERGGNPACTKKGRPIPLNPDELEGWIPAGIIIGIEMSLIDVHVNRSPVSGILFRQKHLAGSFLSLRHPDAAFVNERLVSLIESGNLKIAVIQIASRRIRRIVPFVQEGDRLTIGQRIGKIIFGSQVDILLPTGRADLCVRPGQRMRAGQTILAQIRGLP